MVGHLVRGTLVPERIKAHMQMHTLAIAGSLPQAAQVTGCLGDRRDLHNFPVI
ncbi:unnamed protein product [Penicillium roqueforti FM164]|uniref:Uncharacterized protein n=1 Tax=Penicillium roqueforti (strain FM164) TaxID=1365484 RepID=W6QUT5_PENRF|nr:unnamed protein product [Penicillium roqueforti FM164]